MKNLLPDANYGLLIDEFSQNNSLKNVIDVCNKFKFSSCGFNIKIINSNVISEMKANNLIIAVYSEDNLKPQKAKELWLNGVNSIFIDDPSKFKIS